MIQWSTLSQGPLTALVPFTQDLWWTLRVTSPLSVPRFNALRFAVQSHTSNLPAAVEALDVCLEKNQGHDLLGAAAWSKAERTNEAQEDGGEFVFFWSPTCPPFAAQDLPGPVAFTWQ